MIKKFFILLVFIFLCTKLNAENNFFESAKKNFDKKKYEDSKFLFQRNIVFNPKDAISYLYLAKIFNNEENKTEEEKNLNTVLLLQPDNEEAIYMLMNLNLKNSNYQEVKDLKDTFIQVCKSLCNKKKEIESALKDIEPKNES